MGKRPRLKKEGGKLINEHGVEFTDYEKKRLESAVNSANRKRKNMINTLSEMDYNIWDSNYGKQKNIAVDLSDSDFVIAKKSKSLHKFKSKKEYYTYMNNLKRVTHKDYIPSRVNLYKQNYQFALIEAYGDMAEGFIDLLDTVNDKEFLQLIVSNREMEIAYAYAHRENEEMLIKLESNFRYKLETLRSSKVKKRGKK